MVVFLASTKGGLFNDAKNEVFYATAKTALSTVSYPDDPDMVDCMMMELRALHVADKVAYIEAITDPNHMINTLKAYIDGTELSCRFFTFIASPVGIALIIFILLGISALSCVLFCCRKIFCRRN